MPEGNAMKALIFAAGRGERLKPLTDTLPKPLVEVHGKALIQYHIEALLKAGITEMVINVSWLGQQIIDFVTRLSTQDGFQQANIQFSVEREYPLETGGGMLKALPLLGEAPFVVVNADVYTDFDFSRIGVLPEGQLVKLILVENPSHNPTGDFALNNQHLALKTQQSSNFTYAGIGLYHPNILAAHRVPQSAQCTVPVVFSIVPHIKAAIASKQAGAQLHTGQWHDVGTLERLHALHDASTPLG